MKYKMIFVLLLSTGFLIAMDNQEQSDVSKANRKNKKRIGTLVLVKKFFSFFIEPIHDCILIASNPEYIELQQSLNDLTTYDKREF